MFDKILYKYSLTIQIIYWIEDNWSPQGSFVALKVDFETIGRLQLDITMPKIVNAILRQKKLKLNSSNIKCAKEYIRIDIQSPGKSKRGTKSATTKSAAKEDTELLAHMQVVKNILPNIPICGYPEASRAIIKTDDFGKNALLVEGYGLRHCMTTEGVNGLATRTNSITEMRDVLGIEAARKTIIDEISLVMGSMDIDPRHMQLLADVMTYKGEVLGITRFGLTKMRDSVLQLASFEKTPDHLFDAAWSMKRDRIEGVSECIIMGQSTTQGTGAFKMVRRLNLADGVVGRKATVFEDAWAEARPRRKR